MIQITVQSTPVQAALNELTRRCQHMQPVFNAIGEDIKSNIAMCFREQKSPDGINWAALKPATVAKRRNGSSEILNDTGRLKGSISHVATNSFVEITTDTEYAPFHQFGTNRMVARPFFPSQTLPQSWESDILGILNNHLSP